jgi:ATP-dependent RNA helicase DDX46/PRP5
VFGGKKVKGKKNAITFGLKKREQPIKKILKPSALTQFNIADQGQELDTPIQNPKDIEALVTDAVDESEVINEVDPLDSFMIDIHVQVDETAELDKSLNNVQKKVKPELLARVLKDIPSDAEEEAEEEINPLPITGPINTAVEINQADIFAAAARSLAKKKELPVVDHDKVAYEPFRKDFFMEPPDVASWTPEMVEQKRIDLDGIQVRGKNCPKPIEKWSQFGMPHGIHEVIKKVLKYEIPTPIQAQAIPAIMSGRDVIGIAKTGSGKTIAFLLPMFRHIKDQRPSQGQEGPIGLIMTPTRELALQIFRECKHFSKILGLRVSCCYGGAPIRDQIADLKRGAEIIICTPGRMIDLLCANGGRVTNLKRVSYLVLDEADRMFDLGFEPQVMRMVMNTRPDRQTVLFSATFPRFMEALARKILQKPLEILVGARSVVASDITQIVQVQLNEENKFLRVLAILGKTSAEDPDAKFLIFVDRQESADTMMENLMKRGYPCLSLHGGKDQADRDSVISDFKDNTANILIATSVAARGLDVKDLKVVINFDCPNHLEDYVHRCGRTGRAGNKGTAYTFILPNQSQYAMEIVRALTSSKVPIPPEVQALADKHGEKVKRGVARIGGGGFGGRGLGRLEGDRDSVRRIQLKGYGGDIGEAAIEEDKPQPKFDKTGEVIIETKTMHPDIKPISAKDAEKVQATSTDKTMAKAIAAAKERAERLNAMSLEERTMALAQNIAAERTALSRVQTTAAHWNEVEINDYPHRVRLKIGAKDQITRISAVSNAAITSRGIYVQPGKRPPPGERKLYLVINFLIIVYRSGL